MRPALNWLRTLVLLSTVLMTMGKAAWALESPSHPPHAIDGWACMVEEPQSEQGGESDQDRHTFSGGDDDRGELLMLPSPWQPVLPPDAHPTVMPGHHPPLPWLSLPLRPPQP